MICKSSFYLSDCFSDWTPRGVGKMGMKKPPALLITQPGLVVSYLAGQIKIG
jgi:hypothetical protein